MENRQKYNLDTFFLYNHRLRQAVNHHRILLVTRMMIDVAVVYHRWALGSIWNRIDPFPCPIKWTYHYPSRARIVLGPRHRDSVGYREIQRRVRPHRIGPIHRLRSVAQFRWPRNRLPVWQQHRHPQTFPIIFSTILMKGKCRRFGGGDLIQSSIRVIFDFFFSYFLNLV